MVLNVTGRTRPGLEASAPDVSDIHTRDLLTGHPCPSTVRLMNPDINAREQSGTNVGVRLRSDRFDLITRVLGCGSDTARARLLGLDPKTIWSARRGQIGAAFIAKTLYTLDSHRAQLAEVSITPTFEELFEVTTDPEVVAA